MNITTLSTIELIVIVALAVIVVTFIAAWIFSRKRRTKKLRAQFGGAEYARAVEEGGSRRQAEAGLKERSERVESLKIRARAHEANASATWSSSAAHTGCRSTRKIRRK